MAKSLTELSADLSLKLLAGMTEGVLFLDADNRIAYCNKAGAALRGLSPDEAVGRSITTCHSAEMLPRVLEIIDLLKADNQAVFRRLIPANGRHYEVSYSALFEGRLYLGTIAVSRDVSERVQAEHQVTQQARRLVRLSITDGLTGLFNRRHFFDQLKKEFGRAKRQGAPLSLVMLDLDAFKQYNDSKGHQAGDLLLGSVSRIAKRKVRRKVDSVYRYGGDEMVMLLPGADPVIARKIAGRVREAVERLNVPVTVSLGISAIEQAELPSELVRLADDAMYAAKRAGGNRLCQAPNPVTLDDR